MRMVLALFLPVLLFPALATAQSREVQPHELSLSVTVEDTETPPHAREMVLIRIKGIYRRHITRETLVQPDFEGFSWAQLGPDTWREERLDGKKVKTFERRMAVYPDRAGTLTIGAFRHRLTLTDEGDDWFDHEIASAPVTIDVAPTPDHVGFWFPTRRLRVSDQWSNAPDQLKPGDGVLRIVQLEALGVTPEMIPPMPELASPSAMIFPHPEKRLVELTPDGPITYAFWRWTIRPTNDTSTIVEPLVFSYFDTVTREAREVTISAQRVAYGTVIPDTPSGAALNATDATLPAPSRLPGPRVAVLTGLAFALALVAGLWGRSYAGLGRIAIFDPLVRQLRQAARRGDSVQLRSVASAILRRDGPSPARLSLLAHLDRTIFDPARSDLDLAAFSRDFAAQQPRHEPALPEV